jgi:hypothetical protein
MLLSGFRQNSQEHKVLEPEVSNIKTSPERTSANQIKSHKFQETTGLKKKPAPKNNVFPHRAEETERFHPETGSCTFKQKEIEP